MTPTAPRIAPLTTAPAGLDEIYARLDEQNGGVHNLFATLAHHPWLLRRTLSLASLFLTYGMLPPRERELAILRAAWRAGSVYEFGQHTRLGEAAGLTAPEVAALTKAPEEGGWNDADGDLIAMVDQLCDGDDLDEHTWGRLAARWSEAELIEWVMLVGYYRMVAGVLNGLRIQPEPGAPGWP
jgi:4-carboxymuconolactone decarboxylase